ncbi:exocyst complex component 4 [Battus philenor]|uniref:exocyst complex component 4 n=1 Tax=Battus philenor TaxID=42288 RepID=UPI0035CF8937
MSSPPPTKPPRGVKQGKETSGLLMSVIRTLSASETNEQREKERAKLEKEYKKSDARLDDLVAAHAQEITEVMQKFSSVGAALSAWGAHSAAAVARLAACRALLRLRRADLRRLWADARAHHHALRMLADIERVVVSERACRELAAAGRVLAAAHALQAALRTRCTQLPHVRALSATADNLQAMKLELVEQIVRRLSDAVYRSERSPLPRRPSARRTAALLLAELTKSEEVTDAYLQDITPEYEASLSEEDKTFESTVMISLEALGVLEQLREATEKFKVQIQTELLEVIESVSHRIIEEGDAEAGPEPDGEPEADDVDDDGEMPGADGAADSGRALVRLVACLADEFRACGARHKRLLQLWRAALQRHGLPDAALHTEHHYWSAVQQVLQLLLTEYLEIESVTLAAQRAGGPPADPQPDLRLADYFAKKRPPRRRAKLFRLAAEAPSSPGGARRQRYPLVCRPRPALLYAALPALQPLCAHIESLPGGGECSLRAFVSDYVRWGESERLAQEARAAVEAAARASAACRERTTNVSECLRARACRVSVCAAQWWAAVRACAASARRCGACGGAAALRAAGGALAALCTAARAQHTRLQPALPARAARWLADDDIVRFLQSLPNYRAALSADNSAPSQQELKQAYEREAEILGASLGDGEVARREVVGDVGVLADVALLCESADWLSSNVRTLPAAVGSALKPSDEFLAEVASAAAVLEDISHKCLLFLHLEMRIECFHYLGQEEHCESVAGTAGAGGAEGSGGAAQLAAALLAFHERAAAVLAPPRRAYVMNGLGEMMSAALVWRWQSAHGAPEPRAAGARLAALRHCLAALQLPHAGLHAAHAYLHLLACTPEEIITSVREKGPQFSELEYLNAFKVIGARRGVSAADMRAHLQRLAAALGHVGVTV